MWWFDLETIHGGDPNAIRTLEKLAGVIQKTFETLPPDDANPTVKKQKNKWLCIFEHTRAGFLFLFFIFLSALYPKIAKANLHRIE